MVYLEEGCFMASANASFAARFLALHADLRERIEKDEAFQNWLGQFATVTVDNETYFVVGGDQLRDRDELVLEWARRHQLVTENEINQFHSNQK
jgi:ribosomal protein L16 Arg81 hydroxylase